LQAIDVVVTVLRGEGLVAKDRNWKGLFNDKNTSSDPYVIVKLLSSSSLSPDTPMPEIVLGKTKVVPQSLNPVWDADQPIDVTLSELKPTSRYALQFTIMDEDMGGLKDDLMGVVTLPLDMNLPTNVVEWYEVPADSAKGACGKIQVALETKLYYEDGQTVVVDKPRVGKKNDFTTKTSNLERDTEFLELTLTVIQGDGLVAKDRNLLGQRTSSDPYVEVALLPDGAGERELSLGLTRVIPKTLTPIWEEEFTATVPLSTLTDNAQLRLTINDWDEYTEDDCMGIVHVHVPRTRSSTTNKWYGVPALSANGARGRLQCSLTTTVRTFDAFAAQDSKTVTTTTTTTTKNNTPAPAVVPAGPRRDTIDSMNFAVTVLAGAGLAAKDRNALGQRTTSDPYVKVKLLTAPPGAPNDVKETDMGETKVVYQSLSPVWDETFEATIQGSELVRVNEARLQLSIYDRDLATSDDCMGVLTIPVPLIDTNSSSPRWYGIPAHSARNACGRLQVQVDTSIVRVAAKLHRLEEPTKESSTSSSKHSTSSRKNATRNRQPIANSRDTSAFCTPRRTRPPKKVKGPPAMSAPMSLEDTSTSPSKRRDRSKNSPKSKAKGGETPETSATTSGSDTETQGRNNSKGLDLTQAKNCTLSRFAQQKSRTPSKEMAAFCTPRRTKPKGTVSEALTAAPALSLAATSDNDDDDDKGKVQRPTSKSNATDHETTFSSTTTKVSSSSSTTIYCRPPSTTWRCCCGYDLAKECLFCGMCGTRQTWACGGCSFDDNMCLYNFCGMCGVPKNEQKSTTAGGNCRTLETSVASHVSVRAL